MASDRSSKFGTWPSFDESTHWRNIVGASSPVHLVQVPEFQPNAVKFNIITNGNDEDYFSMHTIESELPAPIQTTVANGLVNTIVIKPAVPCGRNRVIKGIFQ